MAIFLLMLSCSKEGEGFKDLKWGMSPAEVKQQVGWQDSYFSEQQVNLNAKGLNVIEGVNAKHAKAQFKEGKLVGVWLELDASSKEDFQNIGKLRDLLSKKYGPISGNEIKDGVLATWKDETVSLIISTSGGPIFLIYRDPTFVQFVKEKELRYNAK